MLSIANTLSYLQNAEKTIPMLLIEAPTSLGRTCAGYKRGGVQEMRERAFEESIGAVFWLFGAKAFNKIGDFIGKNVFHLQDIGCDVGKDSLRCPSNYITQNKKANIIFKFSKIIGATGLGVLTLGFVVPKIKVAITNAFRIKEGREPIPKKDEEKYTPNLIDKVVQKIIGCDTKKENSKNLIPMPDIETFVNKAKKPSLSFQGGVESAIACACHNLENNTACRLLSSDAGMLAGRIANSRTKKERIEYATRDSISSFFYLGCAPLTTHLLKKATKSPDIHPKAAIVEGDKIKDIIKSEGKLKLGKLQSKLGVKDNLAETIKFEKNNTIRLDEFNLQTNNLYKDKAELMSLLQPKLKDKNGEWYSILSKKQVEDIGSSSYTSDPKFLKKAISAATYGKSDNEKSFVSRKKLEKIRDSFDDFAVGLEKYAKKASKDGSITEDIVDKYVKKVNRNNLLYQFAGIATAVLFLSFLIPKFQYFVSEKLTGQKGFAGAVDVEKEE